MADKFNFSQVRIPLEKQMKQLPKEIANIVKDDSIINFYDESFNGKPWQPPKEPQDHPLLIDTGALLSAVRNSVNTGNQASKDTYKLVVINDYGLYHNEGTDRLPKRQFMGQTNKLDNKVIRYIDNKLTKLFEIK